MLEIKRRNPVGSCQKETNHIGEPPRNLRSCLKSDDRWLLPSTLPQDLLIAEVRRRTFSGTLRRRDLRPELEKTQDRFEYRYDKTDSAVEGRIKNKSFIWNLICSFWGILVFQRRSRDHSVEWFLGIQTATPTPTKLNKKAFLSNIHWIIKVWIALILSDRERGNAPSK